MYLAGDDPLHRWGLARRKQILVEGELVWLAPPEYVIVRKLQYFQESGSSKHATDIAAMLVVLGERLDLPMLLEQIEELHLGTVWEDVRRGSQL